MLTRKYINNISTHDLAIPENAGFMTDQNKTFIEARLTNLSGIRPNKDVLSNSMYRFMKDFFENIDVGSMSWRETLEHMNTEFLKNNQMFCNQPREQCELNVFNVQKFKNMTAEDYKNLDVWAPTTVNVDNNKFRYKNRIPTWQLIGHKRNYDMKELGSLREEHNEVRISGYHPDALKELYDTANR